MKFNLERRYYMFTQDSTNDFPVEANGITFSNEGNTDAFVSIGNVKRKLIPGQSMAWNTNSPEVKDITVVRFSFTGGTGNLLVMKEIVTNA